MLKILLVILAVVGYAYLNRIVMGFIEDQGHKRKVSLSRVFYLQKALQITLFTCLLLVIGLVVGFGYTELTFVLSSAVALLGVALFAQWSVLSNVTASVIIFFFFPYRPGDRIRILEEDCPEAVIEEITLFHLLLRTDDGYELSIPNTMVFQKAVIMSQRGERWLSIRPAEDKPHSAVFREVISDHPGHQPVPTDQDQPRQ
ncbi:mechanosensitive ion channel family protein [Oceanobacter sp. 3_MG-2023]|uniref:mechanosensitive ion channel family protein n=1 Tax=Oceanobacter sp. 3_MG-2023 TaxID=3062622 RepID=UPI002732A99F|nr:mechanosensitive ion channel family protein [Oceanobacter sp. 3_MG-2023]MDP2505121.1 mechanosensitive ion channel family protein [Oceanobacter sp. 3_MG-2023]